jgi:hypothetical protein
MFLHVLGPQPGVNQTDGLIGERVMGLFSLTLRGVTVVSD